MLTVLHPLEVDEVVVVAVTSSTRPTSKDWISAEEAPVSPYTLVALVCQLLLRGYDDVANEFVLRKPPPDVWAAGPRGEAEDPREAVLYS